MVISKNGVKRHVLSKLKLTKLKVAVKGLCLYPLSRDQMRGRIIPTYWNKSRFVIQQNFTILLGADYTIQRNQLTNKNVKAIWFVQQRDILANILVSLLVMWTFV